MKKICRFFFCQKFWIILFSHWNFTSECHSRALGLFSTQFCDAVTCLVVTVQYNSHPHDYMSTNLHNRIHAFAYMNIHTQARTNHDTRSHIHIHTNTRVHALTHTVQTFTQKNTNKSKKRQTQNTWTHAHTHERTHASTHPRSDTRNKETKHNNNNFLSIAQFPAERAQLAYLIQVPIPFPFTNTIYPQ